MKYIAKFIFKLSGWKGFGGIVPDKKSIIIGAPHTSGWDFFMSWLYYTSIGGKASFLIKKEFFFWPMGYFLRSMGGIPVDRSRGSNVIKQVVDEFNKRDVLHLAITPEGTRKRTSRWKGGFHTIARHSGATVYLGYFDFGHKEIGFDTKFELTDDVNSDLKRMRQWYKDKGVIGKYPELFSTGDDLD